MESDKTIVTIVIDERTKPAPINVVAPHVPHFLHLNSIPIQYDIDKILEPLAALVALRISEKEKKEEAKIVAKEKEEAKIVAKEKEILCCQITIAPGTEISLYNPWTKEAEVVQLDQRVTVNVNPNFAFKRGENLSFCLRGCGKCSNCSNGTVTHMLMRLPVGTRYYKGSTLYKAEDSQAIWLKPKTNLVIAKGVPTTLGMSFDEETECELVGCSYNCSV